MEFDKQGLEGLAMGCKTKRRSQGEQRRRPERRAGGRGARRVVAHGGVRQAALVGHRGGLVQRRTRRAAHVEEGEERQEHGARASGARRSARRVVGHGGVVRQAALLHGRGLLIGDAAMAGEQEGEHGEHHAVHRGKGRSSRDRGCADEAWYARGLEPEWLRT